MLPPSILMLHLYYLKRHIRSSYPYTLIYFTRIFDFSLFYWYFCLNKKNLLHVAHCIISLLSFFCFFWKCTYIILSRLFQLVMSLKYEHVLFNWALRSYVDLVQKIINKGATQCKMWVWKNALAFIIWKNHNRMIIIPYYSWHSIPVFTFPAPFFAFIDHKFYKFLWFLKL